MINEKDLVFIYKREDGELFGVTDEMNGYDYELASLYDLDRDSKWGEFVIVKEGSFKWDCVKKEYVKI